LIWHKKFKDARKKIVDTWRRTKTFGIKNFQDSDPRNVKEIWPKQRDISKMSYDAPVELDRIEYKTRDEFIHQMQVFLTNGKMSPLFKVHSEDLPDLSPLQTLKFSRDDDIVTISGTATGKCVRQLIFKRTETSIVGQIKLDLPEGH
jgi:hypothetical protein